jgi:predicted anti-sigma-YlaC factor YlaD
MKQGFNNAPAALHFSLSRAKIGSVMSLLISNILLPARFALLLICAAALLTGGCSAIRRAQIRSVAELFSGPPEANVFSNDNDPELIRDALPFALKTYEALLASDPGNPDLLLAAADAFVTYANAFVHPQAEREEETDYQHAKYLRQRAKNLYLRGRGYALDGLAVEYPGFERKLREDREQALQPLLPRDVPLLYWAAAGWAGAIAADVGNMSLIAELPVVEAMMHRALELDEGFDDGAIHEFFIAYEGGRSEAMGGSPARAQMHFNRVVALTQGMKASPYVSLASSVAVKKQDYSAFKELLEQAVAVDPDAVPRWRLSNILAQEKARWLFQRRSQLFLDYQETEP